MEQKINFKQERDFGTVLGDALKFIKQNFKSFFGNVIVIVGPFLLLMGLGYGYMQQGLLAFRQNPLGGFKNFNAEFIIAIIVVVLFGLIVNVLLNSVVFAYMGLYSEKNIGEKITISEVGQIVRKRMGLMIGSVLTITVLFSFIIGIIVLICAGIIAGLGVGGGILVGFIVFFSFAIFIPILYYFMPASFYVIIRDDVFIFEAMGKVRKYLKDNFWWTWLIMVVTIIAISILNFFFNLPATVISMMDTFSRIKDLSQVGTQNDNSFLLTLFYTLGIFLTSCASTIGHVISAFNFLSQEEKHEGKGLLERIEEIK